MCHCAPCERFARAFNALLVSDSIALPVRSDDSAKRPYDPFDHDRDPDGLVWR